MEELRIVAIGNSAGLIIPSRIRKQMGLKLGTRVIVDASDREAMIVKKVSKARSTKKKSSTISSEFKKWLDNSIKEDGEILDELAVR